MSLNEDVERLRKIPLFAKIEPSKLKLLAFTAQRLTFNANESLFHQGDIGDAAYIIIDGSADVVVDGYADVTVGDIAVSGGVSALNSGDIASFTGFSGNIADGADADVDLVEDQRRRIVHRGQHRFQTQQDA